MTPDAITHLVRQMLYVALELALPFLLIALVIGVVISLIQTLTHVQEMTLSFVPKMLAIACALAVLSPWMLKILTKFMHDLLIYQWEKVTTLAT